MHRWLDHHGKAIAVQEVFRAEENLHSRRRRSDPGAQRLHQAVQLPAGQEVRPEAGRRQAHGRQTRLRRGWARWSALRLPEEACRRRGARSVAGPLRPAARRR